MRLLLEKDADKRDPLRRAEENGHEAAVRLLLEKGIDVPPKNDLGRTPLHWAARRGNEMMARLLLDKATKGIVPMLYPRPAWYVNSVSIVRLASDVQLDQPTVVTPLSSKQWTVALEQRINQTRLCMGAGSRSPLREVWTQLDRSTE